MKIVTSLYVRMYHIYLYVYENSNVNPTPDSPVLALGTTKQTLRESSVSAGVKTSAISKLHVMYVGMFHNRLCILLLNPQWSFDID